MSNFVNKIKTKDGQEYDIQDQRVNNIKVEEGKLHVEKVEMPVGPVPVAEFDGVKYYHKHEFDLEQLESLQYGYDLLTGVTLTSYPNSSYLSSQVKGPSIVVELLLTSGKSLCVLGNVVIPKDYTSRAFTVVQTQEEVTDSTKICLPSCTAYYGFLSEDGKTFISYWNEEGDDPVTAPVSKITDGTNEVEIHDARLKVTSADIGKVVGVNANGELTLVPAPSGGTKLYKHSIRDQYSTVQFTLLSTISTPVTDEASLKNLIQGDSCIIGGMINVQISKLVTFYTSTPPTSSLYVRNVYFASDGTVTVLDSDAISGMTLIDTVTEL